MSERWKPKHGELYYYISTTGVVTTEKFNECDAGKTNRCLCGNCFRTAVEAEAAAEKVKALLLSLHDNDENLQENIQDMVTNTCQAMDKGKENVAKSTCTFGNLPKLTAEVFNRPDCPEWAKWATVDEDGTAYFHLFTPMLYADEWQHTRYCRKIPGKWDATNWTEIIQKPEKKTLPDWCKVGEWVWAIAFNTYFKVDKVDGLFISGTDFFGSDYCVAIENVRQARLRPYNAEEMRGLVGKVIEVEPGQFSLCLRTKGYWADFLDDCDNEDDRARIIAYNCDMLKYRSTIDGSPCGVLEHLENGEWVH